ncbi:hypothetical protein ABL78_5567 [Leptomonas seymouri]|uniref:Uncharacterized protein n=1 Tax=Leptomonas seymouri TaxID=5684 RepID=A0A0N0P4J9_LEPSE|nr:hypothetical protein ABL78_5567 [Leptomonas seymouri]|eukprot:KPI85386.1 hypothetical protein ABL78_5567 [Leptomonas seymouri]
MSGVAAQGEPNAFGKLSLSPLRANSSEPSFACHCIVEDVRGRPASPFRSLFVTPERSCMLQVLSPDICLGSGPLPDGAEVLNGSAAAAAAVADDSAVAAYGPRANAAAAPSNNGDTTPEPLESGPRVTQKGIAIPHICGIPQPEDLQTPAQRTKAKREGRAGPKCVRLAKKGAFSNVTSVAVLGRVEPLERKTRQVEAAGWSKLDYMEDEETLYAPYSDEAEPAGTAPGTLEPLPPKRSASRQPRSRFTEPTVAAATVASPPPSHQQKEGGTARYAGGAEDRAMAKAKRAPTQKQQWRHQSKATPQESVLPPSVSVSEEYPSSTAALHCDPVRVGGPCPIRTAASVKRSPNVVRTPPSHLPCTERDLFSVHRLASPGNRRGRHGDDAATLSASAAAAPSVEVAATEAESAGHDALNAYPVGFAACAERGQQRRADAERAQQEREAEAAGRPLPQRDGGASVNSGDAQNASRSRRSRRLSVLPPPRGFEVFALKGQARRADAEREAAQRQREETENCTHAPRINERGPISSRTLGAAPRKSPQTPTSSSEGAVPAAAVRPSAEGDSPDEPLEPHTSVFDRLSKEAEQRDARLRELEKRFAPSFAPQRVTATAAEQQSVMSPESKDTAVAPPARRRGHGHSVFENLYSLANKQVIPPSPSVAVGANSAASSAAAVGPDGFPTTVKRSEAEIEQYIAGMLSREEERRARWEQQLASKTAEERKRLNRPTLNPKTSDFAERARARYRAREDQKNGQAAVERTGQREGEQRARSHPQRRPRQKASSNSLEGTTEGGERLPAAPDRATAGTAESSSPPARRTLGVGFYEHQLQTEERRCRHLDQLRLQRAEEAVKEYTFRPHLNDASRKVSQRLFVESYGTAGVDELCIVNASRSLSSHNAQALNHERRPLSADLSRHTGRSRSASAQSRCPLPEMRDDNRQGPITCNPSSLTGVEEGRFSLNMQPIHAEEVAWTQPMGAITSHSLSEPLSTQLHNLEEMLREWKKLERECSPMLTEHHQESGDE